MKVNTDGKRSNWTLKVALSFMIAASGAFLVLHGKPSPEKKTVRPISLLMSESIYKDKLKKLSGTNEEEYVVEINNINDDNGTDYSVIFGLILVSVGLIYLTFVIVQLV